MRLIRFTRSFVACFLAMLLLGSAGNTQFGMKTAEADSGSYVPIKWALIILGGYDYYAPHSWNPIQRVEGWVYSRGAPYDLFQDDDIESPTDTPSTGNYPLQYANGSLRYQVLVLIPNSHDDISAVKTKYIHWAVGNGTNTVIFGTAARLVPDLLGISASEVTYFQDYSTPYGVNCTITKSFNDEIKEYTQGSVILVGEVGYVGHTKLQNSAAKTVWYTWTRKDEWGIGMMNGTYGSGNIWYNSLVTDRYDFLRGSPYSFEWVDHHWALIGHAINFMFNNCEKIHLSIQGYKKWKGGIVLRLDQDTTLGIAAPINEEALKAGWVYDYTICVLGYMRYIGGGFIGVSDGLPDGYTGSPSLKVKHGIATGILFGTVTNATAETFIIYNSTVGGKYDRMRIDFNQNQDFSDDTEYKIFQNITYTNMKGKYYWCYIDNQTEPTEVDFGWWCPLREALQTEWLNTYRYYGEHYGCTFGFHEYQHATIGNSSFRAHTYSWDGSKFVANQTYVEEMFNRARNELIYCFGSTGHGFEANEAIISHPGNEYNKMTRNAIGNLSYVLWEYGASGEYEPGFYLHKSGHPILSAGVGEEAFHSEKVIEAYIDMFKTLYSIMAIYSHNTGSYNLSYTFTPYSDMFKPANGRDLYHFWYNARYMLKNTVNAYYRKSKLILEYKANSTLKEYVWKFPLELEGKYFNGFSDNRTTGKIKHIDGKYVYIEFSEGGNERLEATYGSNPHIYQTSKYIENITQMYTPKNLTLQLWNSSGTINVKVNCTTLGHPSSIKINENSMDFNYNLTTKICSFNVTFNGGLKTVEVTWEHAPPNPPTLVSPALASRFDPSKSLTFTWEFSDLDQGDSQSAYRFQLYNFTTLIIDTGKVMSISTQITQTLPNTVGLYYWRVKTWDNRDAEGEWSDSRSIIVDKLKITLKGVTDHRTDVEASVSVYFTIAREYDNAPFDGTEGTVYINGSAATLDEANKYWKLAVTQNSVGEWKYQVSSITDTEHHITTINNLAGTQKVIWDKLTVTITPDATTATVGTQVNFIVTAVYAYDNKPASEFTANILRDGAHFATNNFTDTYNVASTHQYTIENLTEETYGLTAFTSNSPTVTWNPKPFIQLLADWITSNIIIIILIIQFSIVLTYLLIRERKKLKNK